MHCHWIQINGFRSLVLASWLGIVGAAAGQGGRPCKGVSDDLALTGRATQVAAGQPADGEVGSLFPAIQVDGCLSLAPIGPSPFRADAQLLPIDLPAALRLANASNPTIGVAQASLEEAYARLRQARALWLPNLDAGPSYLRHDGLLQTSSGIVEQVNKWNLFTGGGAALSLDTSEAIFAPLVARRLVDAQAAAVQAVTQDIQLQVALTYLDLLRAYGALAVNAETLANAEEIQRLAVAADRGGFGRTPADANRGRTEVQTRRQEQIRLQGQVAVVSARLTQLLLLDPTLQLKPAEKAVLPIMLVPEDTPFGDLVATGLMNRPELAESRALVAASLARWKQTRVAPFLPRLDATYLAGNFGGGLDDNTQRFGSRGDGSAQAVWTLHNFGAGDLARAQASRAQYNQANFRVQEVQARVGAEVSAAANLVLSRQRTLDHAQKAVQQAEEMWRRLYKWTVEVAFRARQYEAVELLLAEQALNQARNDYLTEVIEYNQEQFRLYWALGQPPSSALPKATALPITVPVEPRSIAGPAPANPGANPK
jgi:outer membrane protein TolC